MPAGLIKHHDDVLILGDGGSEAVEELLHRLGVGIGHVEGEAVVDAGFNAPRLGACEALHIARRTLASLPPIWQVRPFWPIRASSWKNRRMRLFLCVAAILLSSAGAFLKAARAAGSFSGWLGRVFVAKAGFPQDATHRGDVQFLAEPLLQMRTDPRA